MQEKELNKKEKRTLMIVSLVLVLTLVLGISFAYFAAQGSSAEQTVTTATFGLEFDDNTAIVNATNIKPLVREDALPTQDTTGKVTKAGSAVTKNFKITNTGASKMYIHLTLDNMTLPDNLRRYDFVWSLYEVLDSTNKIEKNVSNGTFLIEEDNMEIAPYQVFEVDETKEYNLYIWIEESHLNQSVMMGQTFKATITATGEDYYTSPESDFDFYEDYYGNMISYKGKSKNVIIPETINSANVEHISNDGFDPGTMGTPKLDSIVLPNTLISLGNNNSFYGNNLTNILIPNSITDIGNMIFANNQLTNVIMPNSITEIAESAFQYNQLKSVFIPNSVTNIGGSAFANNQLTNIIIPNGVTKIEYDAFANNQLTSLVIPESVTEIWMGAFNNNPNLTEIIILGKSEAPSGFGVAWNCKYYDEETGGCKEYYNVTFRP